MENEKKDYTQYEMKASDELSIRKQAFEQIDNALTNIVSHNTKVRREGDIDIKFIEQTGMLAQDLLKDINKDLETIEEVEGEYQLKYKRWKYYMQNLNAIAKSDITMFKEPKFVMINNKTGKELTKQSKASPQDISKHLDLQRVIYKDDFKEVYGISSVIAMSMSFMLNDLYMHNIDIGRGSLITNTEEE